MYFLKDNPYINERNMFYTVLLNGSMDYEIMLRNGLTESQIIKKAIALRLNTPPDEVDITLQNLYACLVLGNCVRLNKHFRAIFANLQRLLKMRNPKVLLTLPLLLGKIVQTKEMKPSWSRYYEHIIVATVYCVDRRSTTDKLILSTLQFMSNYFPFNMTISAINSLISCSENIRITQQTCLIIFGLRFLNNLATLRMDKLRYWHVRTLEPALLKLTTDKRDIVSKWSIYVLEQIRRLLNVTQAKEAMAGSRQTIREKFQYFDKVKIDASCGIVDPSALRKTTRRVNLSESEIIRTACEITPDTMPSRKIRALRNLGACIECGNCTLANSHFRTILQMLLSLLNVETYYPYVTALNVIEKILRSKQMKSNWSKFLREILLKIITAYGNDEYTDTAISNFMERIAYALPLKETLRIIDTLIATGGYPYNFCGMKLLSELLAEQGDGFAKVPLDNLLQTLIRNVDHPRRKIRLAAMFLIKKLGLRVGELRMVPTLRALSVHNKGLHYITAKMC